MGAQPPRELVSGSAGLSGMQQRHRAGQLEGRAPASRRSEPRPPSVPGDTSRGAGRGRARDLAEGGVGGDEDAVRRSGGRVAGGGSPPARRAVEGDLESASKISHRWASQHRHAGRTSLLPAVHPSLTPPYVHSGARHKAQEQQRAASQPQRGRAEPSAAPMMGPRQSNVGASHRGMSQLEEPSPRRSSRSDGQGDHRVLRDKSRHPRQQPIPKTKVEDLMNKSSNHQQWWSRATWPAWWQDRSVVWALADTGGHHGEATWWSEPAPMGLPRRTMVRAVAWESKRNSGGDDRQD